VDVPYLRGVTEPEFELCENLQLMEE